MQYQHPGSEIPDTDVGKEERKEGRKEREKEKEREGERENWVPVLVALQCHLSRLGTSRI